MTFWQRALRFAGVGALSTGAEWGTLALLTHVLHLDARVFNPLAYAVGIGVNFLGSRYVTFAESKTQSAAPQAARFLLVQLIGMALDHGLVLLSTAVAPRLGVPTESAHWPGKLTSLVVVAAFNFTCHRLWTFRKVG